MGVSVYLPVCACGGWVDGVVVFALTRREEFELENKTNKRISK